MPNDPETTAPNPPAQPTVEDDARDIRALQSEYSALLQQRSEIATQRGYLADDIEQGYGDIDDLAQLKEYDAQLAALDAQLSALAARIKAATQFALEQAGVPSDGDEQAASAKTRRGRPSRKIKSEEAAVEYAKQHAHKLRARYVEPTIVELREGRLYYMDMLEDAIDGWRDVMQPVGLNGMGEQTRRFQERMLPYMPPDVQQCIKAHWLKWDQLRWKDKGGKQRGVKLISGGPDKVREAAQEYFEEHPRDAQKKKSGSSKLKVFTWSLRLEREHYPEWSEDDLKTLDEARTGNIEPLGRMMLDRLTRKGMAVGDFYCILHNRDVYTMDDYMDANGDASMIPGSDKPWHVHFVVRAQGKSTGLTLSQIADALGLDRNFIDKGKSGKDSFHNLLAYLVHAKYLQKTQYRKDEVLTLAGMDYALIYDANWAKWIEGREHIFFVNLKGRVDYVVKKCADDVFTREDIMRMVPDENGKRTVHNELYYIYVMNPSVGSRIEHALKAAKESRMLASADALDAKEFSRTNIYIQGESGTGKTTLAKTMLRGFSRCFPALATKEGEHHWRSSRLAQRNATDQLVGHEVLLLNEMRSETVPEYSTALVLLDEHDSDPTAARFNNNPRQAQRVTIMTTVLDPLRLFFFMPKAGKGAARADSLDQMIRRIRFFVRVLPPEQFGACNLMVSTPEKVDPYEVEIVTDVDDYGIETTESLTLKWRFHEFGGRLTPDGLLEYIVRDIDARSNGGRLAASGELMPAIRHFQEIYREEVAGAVAAGAIADPGPLPLPALPAPAGGDADAVA